MYLYMLSSCKFKYSKWLARQLRGDSLVSMGKLNLKSTEIQPVCSNITSTALAEKGKVIVCMDNSVRSLLVLFV